MVTRILVEKKEGFNVEAIGLMEEFVKSLHISGIEKVRLINCYDLENVQTEDLEVIKKSVLSEPNVDIVREEILTLNPNERAFRISLLPGQFDQRADSAKQCIEIVTLKNRPEIHSSKIIVIQTTPEGILPEALERIKRFMINPVEAHEVSLEKPQTLIRSAMDEMTIETITGFISMTTDALAAYRQKMGFAMSFEDLEHVQRYFKEEEQRDPTVTELKVIDTYWSDHCRHTTFMTELIGIQLPNGPYSAPIHQAFEQYQHMRSTLYPKADRPVTLMDLATIQTKYLRRQGALEDLDVSDEINACSIKIPVDVDGVEEPWLLMFKNETHNHPTEIEPFGGAATCLGGAIRDPLSGRSYVYQSMRVTGSANPTVPMEQTIEGKLPQRMITQKAAAGFSAYGNQIGLATGLVSEVYDEGFMAKRMEVGAVIGAAPLNHVVRKQPETGDVILLIGGRTGRDGVGGATGSSKAHDEESLLECGAEVQKGNPPEERKIQRLFRNPEVSRRIKKCNDFGAGGVSVAIGELADSLEIDLDLIPKKYEGLDGTELAISESQERMAIVVAPEDVDALIELCHMENLEATAVAIVKDHGRLIMKWNGQAILNLSRAFLDTNGVRSKATVEIASPHEISNFKKTQNDLQLSDVKIRDKWFHTLESLNVCSQKGLVERFDNTIGSGTVLMPFGGKMQNTPIQTMVAKIPVENGQTETVSLMSYGYQPEIGKWSPFHGGLYAVVESMAKLVAVGGDYKKARLSFQEYFEKLGTNPQKWGKPLAALLGANYALHAFGTAAIGGKDSMSGTFKDLEVPPTLISFAVTHGKTEQIISPEFKKTDSVLYYFKPIRDDAEMVNIETLKVAYDGIFEAMNEHMILSAYAVGNGGIASGLSKMAFGNQIGFNVHLKHASDYFEESYGGLILEVDRLKMDAFESQIISRINVLEKSAVLHRIGVTHPVFHFVANDQMIFGEEALNAWEKTLLDVFPQVHQEPNEHTRQENCCQNEPLNVVKSYAYDKKSILIASERFAKPRVFVPVFPGTNCEYDTKRAFEKAGAHVETIVFKNLRPHDVRDSIEAYKKAIESAQIVALPGGFSAGDEPEGSGKFIAAVFKNPHLSEAIMRHLKEKDGLMLGICNGFQALIKLGLLPYGEIRDLDETSPTLTFNTIGRHVARMANVRVSSICSPWMAQATVGDVYQTAFSHGEGRFYADEKWMEVLAKNGQIATQYVDHQGNATMDGKYNINGSSHAIEGIFSPDGRVFGKMGHVERFGDNLYKNIYGNKSFDIFDSGVKYFK